MRRAALFVNLSLAGLFLLGEASRAETPRAETPRAGEAIRFGAARHGLSVFGALKYGADFKHFDYVRPDAPKGGVFSHVGESAALNASFLTFDTLNGYILKGNAAQGLSLIFDSLMARALDEPDALYGLIAKTVQRSEDGRHYRFVLREEARFHNGAPLTAHDAAFSLHLLKEKGHPLIAQNLKEMLQAKALSKTVLLIRLSGAHPRSLPLFIASLPIFSKKFYERHDFARADLTPPLGSGPYRIDSWKAGRSIDYARVPDYWARDLPVNRGRHNFDLIRFEYFRDRVSQFEAFKAGDYLFREEFTSKVWATEYDFPARLEGKVKRLVLKDGTPSGAQGWFINMRRRKFQDIRVREALALAFDFEWTNKNQFYDLYQRTESFFENSAYKAEGPPSEKERALLAPWEGKIPDEAFGEAIRPPLSDGSGRDRRLLKRAAALLKEAGWRVDEKGRLADETGEIFRIEFLTQSPTFTRILAPYIQNLKSLGIEASLRLADAAQYRARLKRFDFDMTTERFTLANTPGISLRNLFNASFAEIEGSRNLSGVKNAAVDALIEKAIAAETRAELEDTLKALDRILRALRLWVPQWHKASHHLAFWDLFARPQTKPLYGRGVRDTWWRDPAKERGIAGGAGGRE